MEVYRIKGTIPGNKLFMREYLVQPEMTLYKFNDFLRDDLGFAPDQIVEFRKMTIFGNLSRQEERWGLFDLGSGALNQVSVSRAFGMEMGMIDEFTALRFVYNTSRELFIDFKLVGVEEAQPRRSYPLLDQEKGVNPNQFSPVYNDLEDYGASETGLGVVYDSGENNE